MLEIQIPMAVEGCYCGWDGQDGNGRHPGGAGLSVTSVLETEPSLISINSNLKADSSNKLKKLKARQSRELKF